MNNEIFILFLFVSNIVPYNNASPDIVASEIFEQVAYETSLVNVAKRSASLKNIINADCIEDLMDIALPRKIWALRMIDSGGRFPHGLIKLNFMSIGQYGECIETSYKRPSGREVTGQHCFLEHTFHLPTSQLTETANEYKLDGMLDDIGLRTKDFFKRSMTRNESSVQIPINIGICVPSSCSPAELNEIYSVIPDTPIYTVRVSEPSCSTQREIELSPSNIGTITFLSAIGFIMLCSTLYDVWFRIIKKGDKKDQKQLFVAFSVYTNSERLFTPSKNPGPLSCLHGIRVFSILWIILGHRYLVALITPTENRYDALEWTTTFSSSIIIASTVSVDTFFVMSGLLVSYVFFRSAKLNNIARELPMFYIHRILRLTPLLAVVILLHATLISLYGNGPFKSTVESFIVKPCQDKWWTALLYIQNYVNDQICIGQTWYLAVDMQLYIISPILLYPLLFNKKVGIVWSLFCIAVAQSVAFAIAYIYAWPAGLDKGDDPDHQKLMYIPTHTRATPYFMGVLAGYILFHSLKENNITTIQYNFLKASTIKQILIIVGWLCSLTLLGLVLLGFYPLNKQDHVFSYGQDTFYLAFHRTGWSLGLLWIIVACAYGYGGPINWLLSLSIWEVFGRFSYALYLTHLTIQSLVGWFRNQIVVFDHLTVVYDFFGDVVVSFAISYILIMAFESPIVVIEKLIFKRDKVEKPVAIFQDEKVNGVPQIDEKVSDVPHVKIVKNADEKV